MTIQHAKDFFNTAENKDLFPLKEMELHNYILAHPGHPSTFAAIDKALHDKAITGEQWQRLRAMSEKAGQDNVTFAHILNDDSFKHLETAISRAVNNSPGDPFGAAALHAGAAQLELRQRAVETARANPNMSPIDVARTIEPEMRHIASRYNETLKEVMDNEENMQKGRKAVTDELLRMSKPAEQKKLAEQVQKATEQTAQIKAADQAAEAPQKQTLQLEANPGPAASFGKRTDGTAKGLGYFGTVKRLDNPANFSSELSTDDPVDGKKLLHPLMVPTLNKAELAYLLSTTKVKDKKLENAVYDKAAAFASKRLKEGKSVWAGPNERSPLPTE